MQDVNLLSEMKLKYNDIRDPSLQNFNTEPSEVIHTYNNGQISLKRKK